MNDNLILDEYLLILKSTVEVYVHGTLESSNDNIKKLLNNILNIIINSQGNTYNLMVDNNYYKVSNIDKKDINKALKKLK